MSCLQSTSSIVCARCTSNDVQLHLYTADCQRHTCTRTAGRQWLVFVKRLYLHMSNTLDSCAVAHHAGLLCLRCCAQLQDASSDAAAHRRRQKAAGVLALSSPRTTPGAPTPTLQQVPITIHAPLVVASCGSIHTPALLLRSGVRCSGNVGRHLRLHPAAGLVGFFERSKEQQAAGQGAVEMYQVRWVGCWLVRGNAVW